MDIDQAKYVLGKEFGFIIGDATRVLDYLRPPLNAAILDVGTGMGHFAVILALRGYRVLTGEPASDHSIYAKQNWQSNAQKVGVDHLIRFEPFSAEAMPFADAHFDAIFFYGSLHHVEEDRRPEVMKESLRVVKQEGVICFFEPNRNGMRLVRDHIPEHPDAADPTRYMPADRVNSETLAGEYFDAFIFRKED